jgi:hypothetical protein
MSMDGMFNVQDIDEKVTVENGNNIVATKVGSLRCRVIQLDGSSLDIVINEVKYLPDLCANLFNVNKALKNGFDLSNEGESISVTKGLSSITFDRIIKSLDGTISGIKMISLDSHTAYIAQNKVGSNKSIDVSKLHEMTGHWGLDHLKKTAQICGLKLTGDFEVFLDCAIAKARQKNVSKDWRGESQVPEEGVYLDISSIKDESYGGSRSGPC